MKETDLRARLDAYLALREALGISTRAGRILLQDFVAYLEKHTNGNPIRARLAVDWACSASATRGSSGQASRLSLARVRYSPMSRPKISEFKVDRRQSVFEPKAD